MGTSIRFGFNTEIKKSVEFRGGPIDGEIMALDSELDRFVYQRGNAYYLYKICWGWFGASSFADFSSITEMVD